MTWATITGAGTTTATKFFGDITNKFSGMFNGTDISDTVTIDTAVTWTFKGSAFKIRDSDNSHSYTFVGDNLAGNYNITLPLLTGNDVLVTADVQQNLKNKILFDDSVSFVDEASITKAMKFQCVGITIGNTRVLTVPDFNGTIATLAGTETQSNKTFVAPILGTPTSGTLTNCTGLPLAGLTIGAKTETFVIACSDETTALTTGTGKVEFQMPYAFTVTEVFATVTTAATGGTLLTIDINEAGTTILSTKITLDASEKTSRTAATPPVISDSSLANSGVMTIDIDAVGSTIAGAGLKVYIIGYQT